MFSCCNKQPNMISRCNKPPAGLFDDHLPDPGGWSKGRVIVVTLAEFGRVTFVITRHIASDNVRLTSLCYVRRANERIAIVCRLLPFKTIVWYYARLPRFLCPCVLLISRSNASRHIDTGNEVCEMLSNVLQYYIISKNLILVTNG